MQFIIAAMTIIAMQPNNNTQNHRWEEYECLHGAVLTGMTSGGLMRPTQVQTEVMQAYPFHRDFLIAAQTGSGKTLAFAAPILSELERIRTEQCDGRLPPAVLGLVLIPTHQLALQIEKSMKLALTHINTLHTSPEQHIRLANIIGGMSQQKQLRVLTQQQPHILIATPGRLHQLLSEEVISFKHLKYLVVDEADRMVEMGHFKEVDEILAKVFAPEREEVYDKNFKQVTKKMGLNEDKTDQFYIKKGDRNKMSFSISEMPAQQLFQVPMEVLNFANPEQALTELGSKGKKKQKKDKNEQKLAAKVQLLEEENSLLDRIKRRIFFVSATLTRQFKGTKYAFKKARTEQEWAEKKAAQKQKRKEKEKEAMRKGKNGKFSKEDRKSGKSEQPSKQSSKGEGGLQSAVPKLKALVSRVQFSGKPFIIDLSSTLLLPTGLVEKICYSESDSERMTLLICYLMSLPPQSKVIVFANTIKACRRVQFFIQSFGLRALHLHSHMQQKQRLKKVEQFRKSTLTNVLIATDVAARGLDFVISHVVQVGVPVNGDTYVHRAGRTARANRTGEAMVIVDRKEASRWAEINEVVGESMPDRKVDKFGPTRDQFEEVSQAVEKYEWVRRNTEEEQNRRKKKMDEEDAENLGVEVEEEGPRSHYNMDREEQAQVRHELKRRKQEIRGSVKIGRGRNQQQQEEKKFRKNRLVLSLDEIKQMM